MHSSLRSLIIRIRRLFSRRAADDDFARELDSHLAMLTDENIRRGMPPQEARRAARLRLGGPAQLQETHRELWSFPLLESFIQDIRYAFRMLRKSPGFTAVAVLTLALGIGANTAIFSAAYGILLKPLPFPDSSRIVQIWATSPHWGSRIVFLSQSEVDQIQARSQSFEQLAEDNEEYLKISGGGPSEMVGTTLVSGNFFSLLGVRPVLGRPILPADTKSGHNHVAVLSYELWQRRFGGDPGAVGRTITLALRNTSGDPVQEPFTVIGVLPALFPFPSPGRNQLLIPLVPWENNGQVIAIGRLKKDATIVQANAELHTIASALAAEYPKRERGLDLSVSLLRDRVNEGSSTALLVLLGAVSFVLLLACVNVSSLLIARTWERQREVAVRETLGATRSRLIRQFFAEGVLLSLLGAVSGLLLAHWGLNVLVAIAPPSTPRLNELGLNWAVVGYALSISVLAAMAFSLVPALFVSRPRLELALKGGDVGLGGRPSPRSHHLRNLLAVAEISLAFILVVGSTLAIRSFSRLVSVPMGFRLDHTLTMFVDFSPAMRANPDAAKAATYEVLRRTRSLSGVENAAFADWLPLTTTFRGKVQLEGSADPVAVEYQCASPGYFDTLGIPLLAGRSFEKSDAKDSMPVAIVNRRMAQASFNGKPLGSRFFLVKDKDGKPIWLQVVGEVGDTRDARPSAAPASAFYVPFTQAKSVGEAYAGRALLVRTSINPLAVAEAIRKQISAVDPDALTVGTETLGQAMSESVAEPRFQTQLLGAFGALGLLLAMVGIYGVISYGVTQRTHEIGVRMALGASRGDVLRMVMREGILLGGAGIVLGIVGALALTRFLQSLLFEIKPTDPATFVGVAISLALVALAAGYIPARRAMRVDPMAALRYE
jgi:predicted permease